MVIVELPEASLDTIDQFASPELYPIPTKFVTLVAVVVTDGLEVPALMPINAPTEEADGTATLATYKKPPAAFVAELKCVELPLNPAAWFVDVVPAIWYLGDVVSGGFEVLGEGHVPVPLWPGLTETRVLLNVAGNPAGEKYDACLSAQLPEIRYGGSPSETAAGRVDAPTARPKIEDSPEADVGVVVAPRRSTEPSDVTLDAPAIAPELLNCTCPGEPAAPDDTGTGYVSVWDMPSVSANTYKAIKYFLIRLLSIRLRPWRRMSYKKTYLPWSLP